MYVSTYYCVCVLILLCMCPHTTSGIFNVIWGLLKLLLTEDAQKRFVLIDSKSLTATLKKTIAGWLLQQYKY